VVRVRDGDREMEGKRGTRGTRTPHHHHKQLLVGWLQHASVQEQQETGQPAPHATTMSNCSWGGYGMQVCGNDGKQERGTTDTTPCIDNDASTPHHCCKQQTTSLAFMRGFFVYFISFKISSYSPFLCEEGVLLILRTLNRNVLGMY